MMRNLSLLILAIVAMFFAACHQASEEMKLEVADEMLDLPAERVYESAASADKMLIQLRNNQPLYQRRW